jgi:hypothetical protein
MAVLALTGASGARADQQDVSAWLNVTYQIRIDGPWMAWAEAQGRFGEDVGRLSQSILRPGLGYEIRPGLIAWAGYARINSFNATSQVGEDRFWQQLSWTVGKVFDGTLSSRTRLEQRLLQNGKDTGWRARELVRYEHPFFEGSDMSVVFTSETFMALNRADWGARSGFDQIRNFIGIGFTPFPSARLELGYMNQYIERPGPVNRSNHILSFNLLGRL